MDTPAGNLAAAVGHIALRGIESRLPQWASVRNDIVELARKPHRSSAEMRAALLPQHLFTIDWAMTAPGLSWPERYDVVWLPQYDVRVVTASWDSPETHGFLEAALGRIEASEDVIAGVKRVIIGHWQAEASRDQVQWELFLRGGRIKKREALSWASLVWADESDDDDDDDE